MASIDAEKDRRLVVSACETMIRRTEALMEQYLKYTIPSHAIIRHQVELITITYNDLLNYTNTRKDIEK